MSREMLLVEEGWEEVDFRQLYFTKIILSLEADFLVTATFND